ncbi:MAG: flagellar export chaperone FliS, partial [Planctomycetota bacterium]
MAPRQPTPINTINPQAPEPDAYLRTKVMTARPEELRLMLIDGAIKFATQGRDGLVNKDFEASFTGLSQARDIVLELMTSIGPDADPDLAERVKGLYSYLYSELVKGSFERVHVSRSYVSSSIALPTRS